MGSMSANRRIRISTSDSPRYPHSNSSNQSIRISLSPLSFFDDYELADIIRGHVRVDGVENVAQFVCETNMRGRDFASLSNKDLQKLCPGNPRLFEGLKSLQASPPSGLISLISPVKSSPSIEHVFPPTRVKKEVKKQPTSPPPTPPETPSPITQTLPHQDLPHQAHCLQPIDQPASTPVSQMVLDPKSINEDVDPQQQASDLMESWDDTPPATSISSHDPDPDEEIVHHEAERVIPDSSSSDNNSSADHQPVSPFTVLPAQENQPSSDLINLYPTDVNTDTLQSTSPPTIPPGQTDQSYPDFGNHHSADSNPDTLQPTSPSTVPPAEANQSYSDPTNPLPAGLHPAGPDTDILQSTPPCTVPPVQESQLSSDTVDSHPPGSNTVTLQDTAGQRSSDHEDQVSAPIYPKCKATSPESLGGRSGVGGPEDNGPLVTIEGGEDGGSVEFSGEGDKTKPLPDSLFSYTQPAALPNTPDKTGSQDHERESSSNTEARDSEFASNEDNLVQGSSSTLTFIGGSVTDTVEPNRVFVPITSAPFRHFTAHSTPPGSSFSTQAARDRGQPLAGPTSQSKYRLTCHLQQ